MNNDLSILNSASSFVNDTDDSVFNDEVEEVTPVAVKEIPKPEPKPVKEEIKPTEKKRREWKPDQKLIADMPELNVKPVTYSKDEFKVADDTTLKNITFSRELKLAYFEFLGKRYNTKREREIYQELVKIFVEKY